MRLKSYSDKWVPILFLVMALSVTGKARGSLPACTGFPTLDEINIQLDTLVNQMPHLARRLDVGQSAKGLPIFGLVLSVNPGEREPEPRIRIAGGIHGNECQSVAQVLTIINWLANGYMADQQITDLLTHNTLIFIPVINPDGYSAVPATRQNGDQVDLNRNFGFGWSKTQTANGENPFSAPETRAIRDLSQGRRFTMGISYHTLGSYVNSSWNYLPFHPRDEQLLATIGAAYAGDSDYKPVFGWDWYHISGDLDDWSLGTQGTFNWTIELTSETDPQLEIHQPGLLAFLGFANRGVSGFVRDRNTGEPLLARIDVFPEGEPVYTDGELGDFHRILLPGSYEITASANGYAPQTIQQVLVGSGAATELVFELEQDDQAFYGEAINQLTLSQDVTNSYYIANGYDNLTLPADVLGPPDQLYYSLGPQGTITIDMGENTPIVDGPGADFQVVTGTDQLDPVDVLASEHQDGPFVFLGEFTGTFTVDLRQGVEPIERVRYVRLMDRGSAPFGEADGGYDLDAIVNLSQMAEPTVFKSDPQATSSAAATDDGGRPEAISGGCTVQPIPSAKSIIALLFI